MSTDDSTTAPTPDDCTPEGSAPLDAAAQFGNAAPPDDENPDFSTDGVHLTLDLGLDDEDGEDDDEDDIDPKHLAPLVVDASGLHAHVDALTTALHRYVDLAVGARAEFDAATVEDDPRIEAAEEEIGRLNAAVSEAFEVELGLISGHTTETWESDDLDDDEDEGGTLLELTFTVNPGPGASGDDPLERALEIVEEAAEQVTNTLEDAGFLVEGWSVSRELDLDVDDED